MGASINVLPAAATSTGNIHLHAARPVGQQPSDEEGVAGRRGATALAAGARPGDVGLCLLSGGGSACCPPRSTGITLEDKQQSTPPAARLRRNHQRDELRPQAPVAHQGRPAGPGVRRATGPLLSLIISDVIGDPLDVIASGPTAADPTTFADALAVLERYGLTERVPPAVLDAPEAGRRRRVPETLEGAARPASTISSSATTPRPWRRRGRRRKRSAIAY